ncbi:MAG: Ig-like domain-containing protein, partial [candidate division KSB1 bacterium]|nr:Ig-like domain-containing protein [candidate division KSB1 bacterium]
MLFFDCWVSVDENGMEITRGTYEVYVKVNRPGIDHYQVTLEPDTIGHGEMATIFVTPLDKYGNVHDGIDILENTYIDIILDANGERYGSLVQFFPTMSKGSNQNDTRSKSNVGTLKRQLPTSQPTNSLQHVMLLDAYWGLIAYYADGEEPSGTQEVTIAIRQTDDPTKSATGKLYVRGEAAEPITSLVKPSDSGDNQVAPVNSQLANSLKVRVVDEDGIGVAGITVEFAVTSKPPGATGESFSATSVVTDDNGVAETRFTVGDKPGTYTITASSAEVAEGSPQTFTVYGASIEILDASLTVTDHVQVARWDNAYDQFNEVINGPSYNFIDRDPERFFIRVTDPSQNVDPQTKEKIEGKARIGTLNPNSGEDDELTEITLLETDKNTGIFHSQSQLVMSPDLPVEDNPDDDFEAHDGISATVEDDEPNDRTHRAQRDGFVITEYELPDGRKCVDTVSVCQRNPEERRTLQIRVHVFNEPFDDIGYDHDRNPLTPPFGAGNGVFDFKDLNANGVHDPGEPSEPYLDLSQGFKDFWRGDRFPLPSPLDGRGGVVTEAYVQAQLSRANIAWAQASIRIVQVGETMFVDAPKDYNGKDILRDKYFNRPQDILTVYNTYRIGNKDILDVFFVAPIKPHAYGMSLSDKSLSWIEYPLTFIGLDADLRYRTLA